MYLWPVSFADDLSIVIANKLEVVLFEASIKENHGVYSCAYIHAASVLINASWAFISWTTCGLFLESFLGDASLLYACLMRINHACDLVQLDFRRQVIPGIFQVHVHS